MRYASGAAFRTVLEARLRAEALATGVPLMRLRKTVAFDRLLARVVVAQPDCWLLKGGLALQLRMESRSRTTKDIDLLLRETGASAHARLVQAARVDLGDWFEFEVAAPVRAPMHDGVRMPVRSLLDGREFEAFRVDVGIGDPVTATPERLVVTRLLEFADIEPTPVPCYPLVQHVAEKLHAYTRPRGERENSRVKDLVDLVGLAERYVFDAAELGIAVRAAFDARATHSVPETLPDPPSSWAPEYRRMAVEMDAEARDVQSAMVLLKSFLEPVARDGASGLWDPPKREWE